jgi:hypothetical protein
MCTSLVACPHVSGAIPRSYILLYIDLASSRIPEAVLPSMGVPLASSIQSIITFSPFEDLVPPREPFLVWTSDVSFLELATLFHVFLSQYFTSG